MANKSGEALPFGIKKRKENRKQRTNRVTKHTKQVFREYLPELTKLEIDISEENYRTAIAAVIEQLKEDFPRFSEYQLARNYLAKIINNGNKEGRWLLHVPNYIYRMQRESTFKTQKWFVWSKVLNSWAKEWIETKALQPAASEKSSEKERLASCLVSSALFGGLCLPEAIDALKICLTTEERPLKQLNSLIYIDLYVQSQTQAHNTFLNGDAVTLRRWFPDEISLACIHNYLKENTHQHGEYPLTTWSLVRDHLTTIDATVVKTIKNLKIFCQAAVGVTESLQGSELCQVMIEYLVGRVSSSSLLTPFFEQSFLRKSPSLPSVNFKDATKTSARVTCAFTRDTLSDVNYELVIASINQALSLKDNSGHKSTPTQVKVKLEKILSSDHDLPLKLMIGWLIYLLEHNKKVSSVLRYWSAIGNTWLAYTVDCSLLDIDAVDLELLYKDMLDTEQSEINRLYKAQRFEQFHSYLMREHDFPCIESAFSGSSEGARLFVHAGFIPEHAFKEFLDRLDKLNEGPFYKLTVRCLFILAYRTGLRRSEIVKLKIDDVQKSLERWIYVQNNRHGNNKTSSSLRKIRLALLLPQHEREEFEEYIAQKLLITKDTQSLLFTQALSPHVPIDANIMSKYVSVFLSDIMNANVRFHTLRHSAISRLQLILENEFKLVRMLTCYSSSQINLIQKEFGTDNAGGAIRDIYWEIAGFAGHVTPETTFAHYLHFTDIISYFRLNEVINHVDRRFVKNISGFNTNTLTRLDNRISSSNLSFKPEFHELLIKRLEPFITVISKSALGNSPSIDDEKINTSSIKKNVTPEKCYAVLKQAEQKATLDELVLEFKIEERYVQKWLNNATKLSELETTKGSSRLFSKAKVMTPLGKHLAPPQPQSHLEVSEAIAAIKKLKSIYRDYEDLIKWCIDYFIENTNTNRSSINFSCGKDIADFLSVATQLFAKNRLKIVLEPLESKGVTIQCSYWERYCLEVPIFVSKNVVKNKTKFNDGRLSFRLSHPHEHAISNKIDKKTYSTNVIQYVFHILAIMIR